MITIVTVLERLQGAVKVLRFGAKDVNTPEVVFPYGIDSSPVKGKRGLVADTGNKGINAIFGYFLRSQKTESGEIRVYATNDGSEEKFYIHLKKDGTCEVGGSVDNMVRYSVLKAEYDKTKAVLDSVISTLATPINEPGNGAPSAFQAAMKIAVGAQQTGDIAGCKIDEIKTL